VGAGLHAEVISQWSDRLRTTTGVRFDALHAAVSSDLSANSGSRTSALVSPKLSIAYLLGAEVEVYASGGFGYHSNDARGATITVDPSSGMPVEAVDPLVRTRGGEVGLRIAPHAGLLVEASLLNATNARDNDIAYFYVSRLQGEPGTGTADTHFHPVEPRQIRIRFGLEL
jgi:outer membrane receptor protein involved in Fe transport